MLKVKIGALYYKFYKQELYKRVFYIATIFEQMIEGMTQNQLAEKIIAHIREIMHKHFISNTQY